MYYLKNTNFWMFGLFFFFYFFITGASRPFSGWLHGINHRQQSDTGIIFAAISLFSLLFQPLFGLLSDKLGQKVNTCCGYYRHVSDVLRRSLFLSSGHCYNTTF